MNNILATLLAKTDLFGDLPEQDLKRIGGHFRLARFARGQMLYARGDEGGTLFLIESGQVRLSVLASDGRELSVRIVQPGDIMGEISMLDSGHRSATATAIGAVTAHTIGQAAFDRLMSDMPLLTHNTIKLLCNRLRDTTEQLETIALYPIEVRLARFLLIASSGDVDDNGRAVIQLGFSQGELAQLLGASRPKVNAALGLLEHEGAIDRKGLTWVCDRKALQRNAGFADG